MNGTLNQIRVGQDCDILEFADWCANCSAHIIVVSLTNSAAEHHSSIQTYLREVVTACAYQVNKSCFLDAWSVLENQPLKYATAPIINKKFVLSLFDSVYIIVSNYYIHSVRWDEVECGPATRQTFC